MSELRKQPELGLTRRVSDHRVIDGDTVEVTFETKMVVRLLDCWAPEPNTPEGVDSKIALATKLEQSEYIVVNIPFDGNNKVSDQFTFGRVLGYIYADGTNISEDMVNKGLATKERE